MRRVLVTGASGFIGRWSARALAELGTCEVHAVAYPAPGADALAMEGVIWHTLDLFDPSAVAALMGEVRPSHLLHLAWYAEHGKFWRSEHNYRWVEASLCLLREFRRMGGERAVGAGTCAEYEWLAPRLNEYASPINPATTYGRCKDALRRVMDAYERDGLMSTAWGRVFFLYGPGEVRTRLVPSVITSLLEAREARCTHGNQVRDFMHVADVGAAFVRLLDSDVRGPVNIASGEGHALGEIIGLIGEITGRGDLIRLGALDAPEGEPPEIVADTAILNGRVGFRPAYGLVPGLRNTIEWWRANP